MIDLIGRYDELAVVWICLRRRRAVDSIMKIATRIGDGYVWVIIAVGLALFSPEGLVIVRQLILSFALELSLYKVIKARFSRPRPFAELVIVTMLIPPPDEFSFPSGHTAAAFVIVTVLGLQSLVLGFLLLPVALMIGVSRVYLGVHYPTDVIAGALLGAVSGYAGFVLG